MTHEINGKILTDIQVCWIFVIRWLLMQRVQKSILKMQLRSYMQWLIYIMAPKNPLLWPKRIPMLVELQMTHLQLVVRSKYSVHELCAEKAGPHLWGEHPGWSKKCRRLKRGRRKQMWRDPNVKRFDRVNNKSICHMHVYLGWFIYANIVLI